MQNKFDFECEEENKLVWNIIFIIEYGKNTHNA